MRTCFLIDLFRYRVVHFEYLLCYIHFHFAKMQGQKLAYVVVFVLILVLTLNFTRNALKKKKLEEKRLFEEQQEIEFQKLLKVEDTYRRKILNEMFKEHNSICYKMLVFTVKPEATVNSSGISAEPSKPTRHTVSLKKTKKTNQNINVKKESSEPVIYLFLLVLIYSLITAASDISQHYKVCRRANAKVYLFN